MLAKIGKLFACFKGQLDAQKGAVAQMKKDLEAYVEEKNLEIELSEDEVEPNFGDFPVSSDEEEDHA